MSYDREYYEKNKERILKASAEYKQRNLFKVRLKQSERYYRNKVNDPLTEKR